MAERVYCLYRVSTTKQVDHNAENQADIPMQRKACHEFAERMGWTIIREEQENGISGFKVSAQDRDKIKLIQDHAREGKFDILLVFMFDRIGRIAEETPFVVEELVASGIRVFSVNEGEQRFDNHTDFLTNYIRYWQASGESKKTSIRTRTALEQLVQEGRFRGGSAPYGYRLEKSGIINKKRQEVYKLVIDEEEAKTVKMIFNLCVSYGFGRWRIANLLNEKGLRSREGKNWHEATIGNMLKNIAYKGILRNGKSHSEPFPELQIIDPYTFDQAQRIIESRAKQKMEERRVPLNTKGKSILSGNVFCGHCGGRLTLTTSGKKTVRSDGSVNNTRRIRYACYNKSRKRCECDGQSGYTMHILDNVIEGIVNQIFLRMLDTPDTLILDATKQLGMETLTSDLKKAKVANKKALTEYESLKAEVVKAVQGKSKMPVEILTELVEEARNKVFSTSETVATLSAEAEKGEARKSEMKMELNQIRTWAEAYSNSSIDMKKMIVSGLIDRVDVYKGYKLEVHLNVSLNQFLKGIDSIKTEPDLPPIPEHPKSKTSEEIYKEAI